MDTLAKDKSVRIENLSESNIDDLINVCSSQRRGDPLHRQGINYKKQWLRCMLSKCGSCAKIAYHQERPVAQILFHPEEADVTKTFRRRNVLAIDCIYNPRTEAQRLGIGTRLLESVVQDARQRKSCLGNIECRFVTANAFNTGEFLPMPEFYRKRGFLQASEGNEFWLPLGGGYEPSKATGEYESLEEDRNRAVVFYSPTCQFSYPFARRIEALIREVAPGIAVDLINDWQEPDELIRRKGCKLVVNAKPIVTIFMETQKFKQEIGQALG